MCLSKKVLVVEDDPICHAMIMKALKELGYSCLGCDCGEKAIELLGIHPDVAIVITDIIMKKIDGRELIRWIRSQSQFLTLPILVVSGIISNSELAPEMNLGGPCDFLAKPLDRSSLQVKIDALMQNEWSQPPA